MTPRFLSCDYLTLNVFQVKVQIAADGEAASLHCPIPLTVTVSVSSRRAAAPLGGVESAKAGKLLYASKGDFSWDVCGAKSINVARLNVLAASSGGLFTVPPSVTLPFGTLEALLAKPQNADVADALKRHVEAAHVALDEAAHFAEPCDFPVPGAAELRAARTAITDGLLPDDATAAALKEALSGLGEKAEAVPALWRGVKLVWASKWNDRAVLSRRAQGLPDHLFSLAVLIQVNGKGGDSLGR